MTPTTSSSARVVWFLHGILGRGRNWRSFARRVTVMHEGKILCEGSVAEVQANPHVQEVYLGRSRDTRGGVEVG